MKVFDVKRDACGLLGNLRVLLVCGGASSEGAYKVEPVVRPPPTPPPPQPRSCGTPRLTSQRGRPVGFSTPGFKGAGRGVTPRAPLLSSSSSVHSAPVSGADSKPTYINLKTIFPLLQMSCSCQSLDGGIDGERKDGVRKRKRRRKIRPRRLRYNKIIITRFLVRTQIAR